MLILISSRRINAYRILMCMVDGLTLDSYSHLPYKQQIVLSSNLILRSSFPSTAYWPFTMSSILANRHNSTEDGSGNL